jgi:hypothetical protein
MLSEVSRHPVVSEEGVSMIHRFAALAGALGMVLAGANVALAETGSTQFSVHRVTSADTLIGVACETATICIGVGNAHENSQEGAVITITDGVPGVATPVPSSGLLRDVACWSSQRCVAVGFVAGSLAGEIVPITNGRPGAAIPAPGIFELWHVACLPSPSDTCYAVGRSTARSAGAVIAIVDGVPGAVTVVRQSTRLIGIACPSATTCYAGGIHRPGIAVAVTLVNGDLTEVSRVDATEELLSVSCTSATTCYAAGTDNGNGPRIGVVVTLTNGTPVAVHEVTDLTLQDIGCDSGGNCLITGQRRIGRGGVATVTAGVPGSAVIVNGSQILFGVACPTPTSCIVGGDRARFTMGVVVDLPGVAP